MPQENSTDREKNMGFLEHLEELRERLFKILAVFVVAVFICFGLTNEWVMDFLRQPLYEALPPDQHKLYFTNLFENFMTHIKIAGYSAVFLASPFIFYQVWAFIAPGLYERERKFVIPFILGTTVCFVGGAAFAYYFVFPLAFKFFIDFGLESDTPLLTIAAYYGTCMKLLLLFGLAFELPMLIILLGAMGVVDGPFLKKHRKTAIIGITVACGLFAPPDAISMLLLMAPLILLYELAIHIVAFMGTRRAEGTGTELAPTEGAPEGSTEKDLGPLDGQSR